MPKPSSELVAPFLSYLQKRMDFIAQVATSPPSWCLVTDGDELVSGFTDQYCLVNNIIRSHQGASDGPNFEPELELTHDTPKDQPPVLDIPHGEIGAQAFYTILENIIRNTAKYGDPDQLARIKEKSGGGKLKFTISIKDQWNDGQFGWARDFCEVEIIDMLETKTAHGSSVEGVAHKLNRYFSEPLTNPATGVVNPKNWGMKEIKICAAYLRMVKQHEIDSKFDQWGSGTHPTQPPIITASFRPVHAGSDDSVANLVYTLYFLRPKQALIVSDDKVPNEDDFRRSGIEFCSNEKFRQRTEQGATPRHSFLVVPKPETKEDWDWLLQKLNFMPPRVLVLDAEEGDIPPGRAQLSRSLAFIKGPLPRIPAALLNELWTNWVQRWWNDFKIFVRWSLHADTIAEMGRPADESKDRDSDQIEDLTGSKLLVFDHHSAADTTNLYKLAEYHESISFGSPTEKMLQKRGTLSTPLKRMTSPMIENISRLRIKEAAALTVSVIDERVWLEKDGAAVEGVRHYKANVSRRTVWEKRRVYLQDTNHALQDFDEFVASLSPKTITVFDFLIIHQGIIDNAREKLGANFPAVWQKLERKARWVVIDSGRGQPEQARNENLRWVEYSNLAECLVDYAGNKLKLSELLWTLRASSKEATFR